MKKIDIFCTHVNGDGVIVSGFAKNELEFLNTVKKNLPQWSFYYVVKSGKSKININAIN